MADPVLVVRPEPGNARTVEALRERGFLPIAFPLYGIETLPWRAPEGPVDAVLLTSANAARFGGPRLAELVHIPAYAVGEKTAEAARKAGFRSVTVGGGDSASTVPMIAAAGLHSVLHIGGTETRPFDAGALSVTHLPVYRTVELGNAGALGRALPRDRGVYGLVHSPRAGGRIAALLGEEDRARMTLVAISEAASDACGSGWRGRIVAGEPIEAAMLAGLQMLV